MGKQQMSRPKKFMNLKALWSFINRHVLLTLLVLGVLIFAGMIAAYMYQSYEQKFSKEDYDKLTATAETVLRNSGGKDIQVSRTCSYERPTEISPLHLYCQVELVTYLPYENDSHALEVGHSFEKMANSVYGQPLFGLARFYQQPHDGSDTLTIGLGKTFPQQKQCNFYIQTNRLAKNAVTFLAPKTSDNLIALSFECAAESRGEYFPVTYRQG